MKVSDLLERRGQNWQELERLTSRLEVRFGGPKLSATELTRFASLYRTACADLALADAWQLPPSTVQYLHRLVGRAHNQLYRTRKFDFSQWKMVLLYDVPQRIFADRCVQLMFVLFWGVFLLSGYFAYYDINFAEHMIGEEMMARMQDMHKRKTGTGDEGSFSPVMASFYIQHNTSIGLECFAGGLLIIPGIAVTIFNAGLLGAVFGYMARPDMLKDSQFFEFVTAHGPFELTAIALAAGAGLRLGMGWLFTLAPVGKRFTKPAAMAEEEQPVLPEEDGVGAVKVPLTRVDSLRKTGRETMPLMFASMIMFFMAALIEGFLSPSSAPYFVKAGVAIVSTLLLLFYFIGLGFPRRRPRAA